jgi:hypothetical protein
MPLSFSILVPLLSVRRGFSMLEAMGVPFGQQPLSPPCWVRHTDAGIDFNSHSHTLLMGWKFRMGGWFQQWRNAARIATVGAELGAFLAS